MSACAIPTTGREGTFGFLMGSPPGPGSTYLPSSASFSAPSSLSITTCNTRGGLSSGSGGTEHAGTTQIVYFMA